MSRRGIIQNALSLAVIALIAVLGCETLHNAGVPGLEAYVKVDPEVVERERSCREKFSVNHDHESLYWLLANRVSNGMKLREVEEVLGEAGEYTKDFKGIGSEGIRQTTDSAYKWGPDNSGFSVVIWFRDGHVSNFNPKDYRKQKSFGSG